MTDTPYFFRRNRDLGTISVRHPGGMTGLVSIWSVRYQGELLGLWDPQNRDLRRKLPPETICLRLADYINLRAIMSYTEHKYTRHVCFQTPFHQSRHSPTHPQSFVHLLDASKASS